MVMVRITQKGIFVSGENGAHELIELRVGEVLELDSEPYGWANKYEVISDTASKNAERLKC